MTVEALEKSFLVSVFSNESYPGMTVAVLEAFEELGLNVLEARVSCAGTFSLEAVGGEVIRKITKSFTDTERERESARVCIPR